MYQYDLVDRSVGRGGATGATARGAGGGGARGVAEGGALSVQRGARGDGGVGV
jgi:hypothetical protein